MARARYLGFLSNWTALLQLAYLLLAARLTGASPPASHAATCALDALHSLVLPASLAVVPLYWGRLLVEPPGEIIELRGKLCVARRHVQEGAARRRIQAGIGGCFAQRSRLNLHTLNPASPGPSQASVHEYSPSYR